MTGSNHFVTGALIATVVAQPAAALPLAVASHFVLDALPHYGDSNERSWLNRHFNYILAVDALIVLAIIMSLVVFQPAQWLLLITAGVLATIPDLVWLPYYLADLRRKPIDHGPFARFSKWIQWGERPWGIYIELVVLVSLSALLISRLS